MARKILLLAVCISFLLSMTCFAEEKKEEWQDKTFDFAAVRTIVVQFTVGSDITVSDADQKKLEDLFDKQVLKAGKQRARLISNKQFEDIIGKIIDTDMGRLYIEDTAKYNAIIQEYAPLAADAFLRVNIKALATTQVLVPATVSTYTDYQTTYVSTPIFLPNGGVTYTMQAVTVPVQRTIVIPAHNEDVGHAGAEFILVTVKNEQKLWQLLDMRDGRQKAPVDMTERIFRRAMEQFRELTDYKKK